MTTAERLSMITATSAEQDNAKRLERERREQKLRDLANRIEGKAEKVFPDLFAVAESIVRRGYYLGEKTAWDRSPIFCTDGIGHRFGFFLQSGNPFLSAEGSMPVAIGCKGGGWNGKDFKILKSGSLVSFNYNHCWCRECMQTFEKDLDNFCARFYEWVDSGEFKKCKY